MTGKIKKPLLCLRLLWKEDPRGKNERKKGAVLLCGEGRAGLEAKGTLSCRCTCESQRMLSFCHFPLSREPQVGRPISRTWDHDPADTQLTEPCRCPENRTNFKQGVSSWVKWSCKRWGAKSWTGTSESRSGAKMPTGDPRESKVSGLVSLWVPPVYSPLVTGAGGCVSQVDLRSLQRTGKCNHCPSCMPSLRVVSGVDKWGVPESSSEAEGSDERFCTVNLILVREKLALWISQGLHVYLLIGIFLSLKITFLCLEWLFLKIQKIEIKKSPMISPSRCKNHKCSCVVSRLHSDAY